MGLELETFISLWQTAGMWPPEVGCASFLNFGHTPVSLGVWSFGQRQTGGQNVARDAIWAGGERTIE